ncbi:hypothetical protein [uncultured Mitsuokella sp.]|uniref:hypothetical protein n=1 Tax=uncultured Mitsuokella sp. TaxID=453120 RepID=UPI00266FC5AB|nr:hypothetical protein [uncultured Mitsuokella sp.]
MRLIAKLDFYVIEQVAKLLRFQMENQRSLVRMAKDLGVHTLAEGVETSSPKPNARCIGTRNIRANKIEHWQAGPV